MEIGEFCFDSLYIGKKSKGFSALCREVGCTAPTSGREQENIEKRLKRYINWSKTGKGNELMITDIYDTPKEKVDNRGKSEGSRGNNDKYQNDMSILIEHYLATSGKEEFLIAISTLACNSNIVSGLYKDAKKEEKDCINNLSNITNKTAFDNTMFNYSKIINNSVCGALTSLQKQDKLEYKKNTFVVIDEKVKCTTKEMDKKLDVIRKQVIQEIIDNYSYGNRQITKKTIMNNTKLRNKYYDGVFKEFHKEYRTVTSLFEGVIINTINCKVQDNILEVSNRLNNTLMENVLEKNKKQVVKVKNQYKRNNNEANKNIAFGDEFVLPLKPYETDIIENELSYIEDTIKLTELLCGETNQDENGKVDAREQNQEIELIKHLKLNDVKTIEKELSKEDKYLDDRIIDITKLKERPIPTYKKCKERSLENFLPDLNFIIKRDNTTCEYINNDDEHMTLDMIRDDLLKCIRKKKVEIDFVELGIREGNILELKRELKNLNREYDEINQIIIGA